MLHHTAVRVDLPSGSGWHYAAVKSTGGHPIGSCPNHPPHPTEDDARRCYREHQRANIKLLCAWSSGWADCSVPKCGEPTHSAAESGPYNFTTLCPEHLTAEHAIVALGLDGDLAGDAWES